MFPTVEYQYASICGTYWVPCDVIERSELGYTIKFFDSFTLQEVVKYDVPFAYLKFPTFSELTY